MDEVDGDGMGRRGTHLPESPYVTFDIARDALVCVKKRTLT